MSKQNYEIKNDKIKEAFLKLKAEHPERLEKKLNFSWSNWGFGMESLDKSAERLHRAGIKFIELHGNHYGEDLGYKVDKTLETLAKYDLKVSGVCGMFADDNDLSSNKPIQRQAALDYLKREIKFTHDVGGKYLLVVPGSVGRSLAYDNMEFARSVETLQLVADLFTQYNVKAAIEPIRSAEVSFIHTFADALEYIGAVNHPGVQHINGDVYHMQSEESHMGEAIMAAGEHLFNLHLADSNRSALGEGFLDLDTVLMALYLIGYNNYGGFLSPEPLGPGGAPYPAMYGRPDKLKLDALVINSYNYFKEREQSLCSVNG